MFEIGPNSLLNIFPDVNIEKIDITNVVISFEIQKAPGKFWPFDP